jgi:hypothetical protein
MDIMGPPLQQQVSPAPWLIARHRTDVRAMVAKILESHPDASPDEIVRVLADRNVQANGVLVAQQVLDFRTEQHPNAQPSCGNMERRSTTGRMEIPTAVV